MGTRRVPPLPPALRGIMNAEDDTNETAVSCRTCWRDLDAGDALQLPCGDVICGACLAELARASLSSRLSMLPLRCCWMPIPAALLRPVLAPQELAFYVFRTRQRVDEMRETVATKGIPLTTRCDFCLAPTRLATPQTANELLLACGHVYCGDCVATMKQSRGDDKSRPICCHELLRDTGRELDFLAGQTARAPTPAVHMAASVVPVPAATALANPPIPAAAQPEEAAMPRLRTTAARRSAAAAVPPFQGKGKRRLQVAQAVNGTADNVVDLLDDSDEEDGDASTTNRAAAAREEEDVETCIKCAKLVDVATNRFRAACGHVFCQMCLLDRCLRALRNEEQGSIGVPVRCCHALVSLDLLRAVLSKRNFVKYEALVAKRGDVAIPPPPRQSRKRKASSSATATSTTKRNKTNDGAEETKQDDDAPAECVACMTSVDAAIDRLTGPCGHVYCLTCLTMMAKQSLDDRALVPIRCCSQEFPIDYVKRVLNKTQFAQYDRFLKEKDWRTSDLKSDKEYAAMVKAINGKQCPTCGVGVQKISGCDAIRCLRGHLFCFACEGAPCTCGRTRLESYGWVPPPGTAGTQPPHPNAPNALAARAGAFGLGFGMDFGRLEAALFGGVRGGHGDVHGAGFIAAMEAANARGGGRLAHVMGRGGIPANQEAAQAMNARVAAAIAAADAPVRARARAKAPRPRR